MRQVTGSMANVVRGMDGAMKSMDLEKVRTIVFGCSLDFHSQHTLQNMPSISKMDDRSRTNIVISQISNVMDRFETQFEDLDVATGYYENATSSATAVGTPQDDVDRLMNQVADEAGVELQTEMRNAEAPVKVAGPTDAQEEGLGDRLRALRN